MVCLNCGKEIPNNSAYCIFCHAPTGLSEDISVNLDILEDDELIGALQKSADKPKEIHIETEEKTGNPKKKIIISLVSFICCASIVVASYAYINSYNYIIKKANKAMESGEYDSAYKLYEKALVKNNDSVEALLGAGEASKNSGNFDESEKLLKKALDIDEENNAAFASLLDLYDKTDHQDKISDAEKYVNTQEMKATFSEKAIEVPVISLESGQYNDEITITLSSSSDLPIYYTLDGKDPTKGEGLLYQGEILISEEGEYTLKACCNKEGKFGKPVENTYVLEFLAPQMPQVSPMTGSFTEETRVVITSEVTEAKIYYTWDGTNPTESSKRYTEPLVIPEGNNVLSIIAVSKNGKISDVLRVSYTYIPGTVGDALQNDPLQGEKIEAPTVSGEGNGNPPSNETEKIPSEEIKSEDE